LLRAKNALAMTEMKKNLLVTESALGGERSVKSNKKYVN
jgi:hypothetical protein